jgi:transcriptional regulator with PAS, ATPase and Fis domain
MNGFERYRDKRAREREAEREAKSLQSLSTTDWRIDSLRQLVNRLNDELEALNSTKSVLVGKESLDLSEEVRRFEIGLIKLALQRANGRQIAAAKMLNVKVSTLNDKIKRYQLD